MDVDHVPGGVGGLSAQRYIDNILEPGVDPYINANCLTMFMQDNGRPHTIRMTTRFLNDNNIDVLPRPAQNPDMNPFIHVWDYIASLVLDSFVLREPSLLGSSCQVVYSPPSCDNITLNYLGTLLRSMRRRVRHLWTLHYKRACFFLI